MSDERLPELYHDALELDAAGRERLLCRVERDEPELAGELRRLLAEPDSAASPIDGSALADAGVATASGFRGQPGERGEPGAPGSHAADPVAVPGVESSPAPPNVGPYRIVRELGRGGMGRVFLAEQKTPDFRRTVALKLIDRPGPDDEAVRRFRDEVRILAGLDHPNIVRFLDGGKSPEGVWFLALEYVEGEDLLAHARNGSLDARQRVELLLAVAEAVAFAHGRGVVHRDLKPSNVLVGKDGRPRLLDFGISKLLDPSGSSELALLRSGEMTTTRAGVRPFTPAYASPEQIAGGIATAASDVYSLGIVLFELLAGRRPLGSGSISTPGSPSGSSVPPETPSAALRRSRAERRRATTSETTAPAEPRLRVGRDLDAICSRALQFEPGARYPTAAELVADLRRYLARRPLTAPGDGWIRRASAALGTRRTGVLVAAAIALVAAGIAITTSPREQPAGETPLAAAPQGFPFDPSNPPPATESEKRLVEAPDDVVAGAALALRLARDERVDEARMVLGRMRQVPGRELDPLLEYAEGRIANQLGEDQRALVLFTRARDRALVEGRGELLGAIRTSRGAVLSKLGQRAASLAELEQARLDSERAGDHRTLYRTLNGLALEHLQKGEMEIGAATLQAALVAADKAGLQPTVTLENLVAVHAVRGRPDLAEPIARRLIEQYRSAGRTVDEAEVSKNLALVLRELGRADEAAPLLDRAIDLLRPSNNANALGDALQARGAADLDEARLDRVDGFVAELEATAQKFLKRLPLGYAHWLRARRAAIAGDLPEARRNFAEARRLILADGNPDLAALASLDWAETEIDTGAGAAALAVIDEALAAFEQTSGTMAGFFAETLRARIDGEADRAAEGRQRLDALGPLGDTTSSPSLLRRIACLRARAAIALAESRNGEARGDLESALELARACGRKLDELEIRLALASLNGDRESRLAVEREARDAGLVAIADRARDADPRAL